MVNNEPLGFVNKKFAGKPLVASETDLVQSLLYEIMRVKELLAYYASIPNGGGKLGASILNELIEEAHNSLISYDVVLMKKYYELLQNCD